MAWTQPLLSHGRPVGSPLYLGLQEYLKIHENDLFKRVIQHSLDQLPQLHGLSMQMVETFCSSLPSTAPGAPSIVWDPGDVTLFFDTAGTGKSTAIQNRIRKNFGFYCVAPNLLPSDLGRANSLVAPDRACASRDTYSIYADFKALEKLDVSSKGWEYFLTPTLGSTFYLSSPMHAARNQLFRIFQQLEDRRKSSNEERQIKWLQLQISCWSGNDPIDLAYRFIRLQTDRVIEQDAYSISATQGWAFDEAQEALGDRLATRIMSDILLINKSQYRRHCYMSGTSIMLQEMEQYLSTNRLFKEITYPPQRTSIRDEVRFFEVLRVHARNIVEELNAL